MPQLALFEPSLSDHVPDGFDPLVTAWFRGRFGEPTEAQRLGWEQILAGRHTLIAAPTGSGKTLAAFLASIDRLIRAARSGELADVTSVVYVSPLKALSNDIRRNLETPLAELGELAAKQGAALPHIRAQVRTGDTPAAERQAMARRPPHILVTTPESLYLVLTSPKGREALRHVETVIVDEIHALARDKRGSHLALSLERLEALCQAPPVRIGLSATQRPLDEVARFLIGSQRVDEHNRPDCAIVDIGHSRSLDLAIEVPPTPLAAVCAHETWDEIYERLAGLIESHRSTLIFVNTRRLAERVAQRLIAALGEDAVASHHGSLSREIRLAAEERLKTGQLRAIVATASLELGIDVGYIDLVCQIGSPRSIATLLQRVGRSGHALGLVPKGRLFPLTRDELVECLALVRAVHARQLDAIVMPAGPLDVLAQQIVAMAAVDDYQEDELLALCRRAWPYRQLSPDDFQAILQMLSEGFTPATRHGIYLHRDQINLRVRARRGARIAAVTSGGTIPETGDFRVVLGEERTFIGTVNEDFALESLAGDVFILGNNSWRIRHVRGGEVLVDDAHGAPATVPFWLGEAPARTAELSTAVSELRRELAHRLAPAANPGEAPVAPQGSASQASAVATTAAAFSRAVEWLTAECGASPPAAEQAAQYVAAGATALGVVPSEQTIVFERFFDESGGMQLVIHSPLGARINRAWGLALRKRFCRSFDFELQAAATDNGILLSLGPQHSFAIEALFPMLNEQNAEPLLVQALLAAPLFQTRWRWNVTRALAVLRQRGGKRVPPYLQRFRADDLLAAAFPQQVGCLENHSGDVSIPDHPLVRQTIADCLHEAMDVDGWIEALRAKAANRIEFVARDTREPSPFSHELLNANPYAFLDDAPLEERRVRAVTVRRSLGVEAGELGSLDRAAIEQVVADAQPIVRDADELHDALLSQGTLGAVEAWRPWFDELVRAGRATSVVRPGRDMLWTAAERLPMALAALDQARAEPPLALPSTIRQTWKSSEALVALLRGHMQCAGPVAAGQLAQQFALPAGRVEAALEALEGEGMILRGRFTPGLATVCSNGEPASAAGIEWCDRRLLARIHRLTLDGLRRQIQPLEPHDFIRFLAQRHGILPASRGAGRDGLRRAIEMLEGLELPSGAWEPKVLAARVADYDPAWLDELSLRGEVAWGRLRPPRRREDNAPSQNGLTRAVPLSLVLREDLPWLAACERPAAQPRLRGNAQVVLEVLRARGALFYHELRRASDLLSAHLDAALQELAATGLVTADAFAAVRWMTASARGRRRQSRLGSGRPQHNGNVSAAGRWSLFPPPGEALPEDEILQRWAWQLLKRWGVVFYDLVAREPLAPRWGQLVRALRRLEARGEIRGGRFVGGVTGEQYALGEVVDRLRAVRDSDGDAEWFVISAVDPLNLTGVITREPRVASIHTSALVICGGRLAASKQAGTIELHAALPPDLATTITRALRGPIRF